MPASSAAPRRLGLWASSAVGRLTLGWGCWGTSLMISQVALLVWSLENGGAGLVAAYENAGGLAGPAVGGALVAAADPAVALAGSAGVMALGLVALFGVKTPEHAADLTDRGSGAGPLLRNVLTGVRGLFGIFDHGGVGVLALLQTFTRGLLLVLTVVLALDVLALRPGAVGWLNAMIGLGGLVGGALAGRMLRLARLARAFVLGVALWGLPLAVLGLAPSPATAFLALLVVGVGNALEDGSMFTLIPRAVGPAVAPMALGALELVAFAGVGIGAVSAPALSRWPGTSAVLALDGGLLMVLAGCYAGVAVRLDATMAQPAPELELVQTSPIFAPLPLITVERLTASASRQVYPEGTRVITEGEPGDTFYLIADGSAAVTVHGDNRPSLGLGEGFGEIALLQDVPRTATVTAAGTLTTLNFARAEFLAAVSGNSASLGLARGLAGERLARDDGTVSPPPSEARGAARD